MNRQALPSLHSVSSRSKSNNSYHQQNQMLVKGVTQLYGRVFNHHAILQSEINHTKEFDSLLQSATQSSEGLSDQIGHISTTLTECNQDLPSLTAIASSLIAAKQMSDTVLLNAGTHTKVDYLTREHESRAKRWAEFTASIKIKSGEIEAKFASDCEDVKQRFEHADRCLNKDHSPHPDADHSPHADAEP